MSKAKSFEQIDMFQTAKSDTANTSKAPSPAPKSPFVPVQTMALDDRDIKNNFMYMIRILLNKHQKTLSTSKGKAAYLEVLLQEMKIKKGLSAPAIAIRTCALNAIKKI